MPQRTVVLAPAPTANGDLHVGHLSGPFLAADVYARFRRAAGDDTLFSTGVQETQTFVLSTARRLGLDPHALTRRSEAEVRATLDALGISVDGFAPGDERFRTVLVDFLTGLRDAGVLVPRTMAFPYAERTGEYLMEAYVQGTCPVCLAGCCGGVCESCGHHNNPGELLDPRCTADPGQPLTTREATVLVLPLERYREELTAHYRSPDLVARPHMRQAVEEMLARPLPDFPVTFPSSWGIPAPWPEVAGQVINPAVEAFPAGINGAAVAARARGHRLAADDEVWRAGGGTRIAYFMGFDNTHPFALVGVALLKAYGSRYVVPTMVTNEFYELDHEKFSTSRGHVLWGRDLVAEVPRDAIRYFLAATSPEHQRSNFSRAALTDVVHSRLTGPWNQLSHALNAWLDTYAPATLPVGPAGRNAARLMTARFEAGYDLPYFSLNRTAETISAQLARLVQIARRLATDGPAAPAGDLCLQVDTLVRCAAPVLVDLADAVLGGPAPHPLTAVHEVREVPARRLPPLPTGDQWQRQLAEQRG